MTNAIFEIKPENSFEYVRGALYKTIAEDTPRVLLCVKGYSTEEYVYGYCFVDLVTGEVTTYNHPDNIDRIDQYLVKVVDRFNAVYVNETSH